MSMISLWLLQCLDFLQRNTMRSPFLAEEPSTPGLVVHPVVLPGSLSFPFGQFENTKCTVSQKGVL